MCKDAYFLASLPINAINQGPSYFQRGLYLHTYLHNYHTMNGGPKQVDQLNRLPMWILFIINYMISLTVAWKANITMVSHGPFFWLYVTG